MRHAVSKRSLSAKTKYSCDSFGMILPVILDTKLSQC